MSVKKSKAIELPEVNFSEHGDSRYLHLGTPWIQGAMNIKEPFELELEYVQRMMAGLLFLKSASVAGRHAMQLGLGAASLTKFCYKKLKWTCTAIELNPGVLHACRGWFKLPEDGPRMRVIIAELRKKFKAMNGWARSTSCTWTCTTTRQPHLFWTPLPSIKTAVPCSQTKAPWRSICLAAPRVMKRAWPRWQKLLGRMPCGRSSPPERATRWSWRSAHPAGPNAMHCSRKQKPLRTDLACPPPNGCAFSSRS